MYVHFPIAASERVSDMAELSHINEKGDAVMVDVSDKRDTVREARASGKIYMNSECFELVSSDKIEKGNVQATARIAGIMGAKRTFEIIPLCHMLNLTKVHIDIELDEKEKSITAICTVRTTGKTGVEMEALTGAATALLTIYDMCKAVDKAMRIEDIHLLYKTGGKSGAWEA